MCAATVRVTSQSVRLRVQGGETCIDMSKVAMLVLDEADRMLEMGFEKDIQKVNR